jgi:hypothetical protein
LRWDWFNTFLDAGTEEISVSKMPVDKAAGIGAKIGVHGGFEARENEKTCPAKIPESYFASLMVSLSSRPVS